MNMTCFRPTRILLASAFGLLALSGCARIAERFTPEDPTAPLTRPNDSCDSAQYRRYIGQSSAELYDLVMVGPVRMIPAGSAVTADHNPVRVNFDIDVNGVISGIWCG